MKFDALKPFQVKNFGPGKYNDGRGLWLHKRSKDRGQWFLRLVINGKRREMCLGGWPNVGIAEVREHAERARRKLRSGIDPIEDRRRAKAPTKKFTLEQAIRGCFEARQAELKGDGQAGRWMSPLSTHVIKQIGHMPVEEIDQHILKKRFNGIWHEKPSAAAKALSRIHLSLKHAAALGLEVDLQAVMKTKALLGKQRHTSTHIPSLPYQKAPDFYQFICSKDSNSARALQFLMLTCTRSGELRFATWSEIDGDIWTIPAERTKQAKEHRVPLTAEAQRVLQALSAKRACDFIFPAKPGKPMSDAAMAKFMKTNGYTARPHGLRATFRSWAEEQTNADWETKEMCLGHAVGSKVERAYQRSDLIQKRRDLLNKWQTFLLGSTHKGTNRKDQK